MQKKKIKTDSTSLWLEDEKSMATLISNLPGMVYRCKNDPSWTMIYISEGSRELTGYDPEDFIDNKKIAFNDIIVPEFRDKIWQDFQITVENRKYAEEEYKIITKDGRQRWVWERGRGVFDDNGNLLYLEGFITDITRRKEAEEKQSFQLAFERIVAELSTGLVNITQSDFDRTIKSGLQRLGELFEVDRSYIFRFSDDLNVMSNTHEWCAEGISPQMHRVQNAPADALPWLRDQMQKLVPLHVPDVDELPPEAELEKQECNIQGIKSAINLPMQSDQGKLIGHIGFDVVRRKQSWPQEQITMLQVAAEIIASAMNRREAYKALQNSEERYRLAQTATGVGIWEWHLSEDVFDWDNICWTMLGYEPRAFQLNRDAWKELIHPDDLAISLETIEAQIHQGGQFITESRHRKADGGWLWIQCRGQVVEKDPQNKPVRVMGTHTDITVRKKAELDLLELATVDSLTGLANRRAFIEQVDREITRLRRTANHASILMIDIDHFKNINDQHGHAAGDAVLKELSELFRSRLRKSDVAGRLGGEEFSVLLPETGIEGALIVAEHLRQQVDDLDVKFENKKLKFTISIGVAEIDAKDSDSKLVLAHADYAMYQAKQDGRNKVARWDQAR
jgi:diguanylate cyclase (GGDEF)-like protein/PAS domain S-box-containing protein